MVRGRAQRRKFSSPPPESHVEEKEGEYLRPKDEESMVHKCSKSTGDGSYLEDPIQLRTGEFNRQWFGKGPSTSFLGIAGFS